MTRKHSGPQAFQRFTVTEEEHPSCHNNPNGQETLLSVFIELQVTAIITHTTMQTKKPFTFKSFKVLCKYCMLTVVDSY